MDWLSILANVAQIFSVLWTLAFGGYALHEVLSKVGKPLAGFKILPKINIYIFFLITVIILLIAILMHILTSSHPQYVPYGKGLDLEKYCTSLGYTVNSSDKSCYAEIALNDACHWQYQETNLKFELINPSDLMTGVCSNSQGVSMGGISDMSGYCKSRKYKGSTSEAGIMLLSKGNTWVCQTSINTTIACIWQNSIVDMQARENDKLWICYKSV